MKTKLYSEEEVKNITNFKGIKDFLDSELEITEDLGYENPLIKGCTHSGKTTKVLIPLFKVWRNGKLYINIENKYQNEVIKNENIYEYDIEKDKIKHSEIVNLLLNNKAVYLNITNKKIELANKLINNIFKELKNRINEVSKPILLICDDLHLLGKINYLPQLLIISNNRKKDNLNKNIYIAAAVQYSRQLLESYDEEEYKNIKKYFVMYDVEKQPISLL